MLRRTDLSAGGKLAFGRLNRFIGHNESGWPSRSTLAMELGACVRSVANWIGELRELGLLKWKRRPGTSSVYSSKGVQTVHMQTVPTLKANDAHPVGKPCTPGVQTVPTEKKKKRVKEKMSSTAAALAAELYQHHPQSGLPKRAIPEIEKLQAEGVADDGIRSEHARACRQWATHKGFVPQLWRWLREDFVPPQKKPPASADEPRTSSVSVVRRPGDLFP